jgi:phenylalanyl-tRNA synthetase alpha chain
LDLGIKEAKESSRYFIWFSPSAFRLVPSAYLSLRLKYMGVSAMKEQLEQLRREALNEIEAAEHSNRLNEIRIKFLGKKGSLTAILREMGKLSPAERPVIGELANQVRQALEAALDRRGAIVAESEQQARLAQEEIDIFLPGRIPRKGHPHPLQLVMEEVEEIFLGMGFTIAEGPEVELDHYNFEALNLPKNHPARDMQDSLYISPEILLRTHTSPVQVRTMEKMHPNPVRVIAPGRVYRRDALDATHSPMFHQIEGLVVDQGITFGDLKGVLTVFAKKLFGAERQVRFRPSFFPFTEPSAEVDVSCGCAGKGCRVCKGSGWLEILGSGSVNPVVLQMANYDPEIYSGFAFGMGVERIAMLKYGINDIRVFFENDQRSSAQF